MAQPRVFTIPGVSGRVIQGGADAVRSYYSDAAVVIVNCARRHGDASILAGPPMIYWFPMVESSKRSSCARYVEIYGPELLDHLVQGTDIVVNCQEGLHRSVEFATQLVSLAKTIVSHNGSETTDDCSERTYNISAIGPKGKDS